MRPVLLQLVLAVALFGLIPGVAESQFSVSGRGATVTVGGLLQPQYTHSSIAAATNDFNVRRARMRADAAINEFLRGRVVAEFGGSGSGVILDADISFVLSDAAVFSFGQFKRAFDLFHLPNPGDPPEIERQGGIEGYSTCAGVGSICSYSRFTEGLLWAGRDIGLRVNGAVGPVSYDASVTNGPGLNNPDENEARSYSARAGYAVRGDLVVYGQVGLHDYVDPSGNAAALAVGGEVEYGTWREGWHVRAGVLSGDNWRLLDPTSLDPASFLTGQAIVTYYYALGNERVAGVEPLARISYGDPDTASGDNRGILLTPGFAVYFMGKNRLGANLDVYSPEVGDTELSFKVQSTLYF